MPAERLRIVGVPGSPYSRKLRAVLRYRRIPHVWITQGSPESRDLPVPRVPLLPQLIVAAADGTLAARTDSTPLIRELEARHHQGKCLAWLRQAYDDLAAHERRTVDVLLAGTGCEPLLAA